jgi:hypothetical protein
MEIKGPTGSIPVDTEPTQVQPGTASRESRNASAAPSQSVLIKLSPNLFKLGQVLSVTVARVEQNALLLMLQDKITDRNGNPINLQLRAPKVADVEPGQRLQVQVTDLKQNIPTLKIIDSQRPAMVLSDLISQAQTKQQPLQQMLNNLVQIRSTDSLLAGIPKAVTERIDSLWRALPEQNQLQRPDNVKQAIQYAGPFLESQLLKMGEGSTRFFPARDTKNNLLRLAEALRQQNSLSLSRENAATTTTTNTTAQPTTTSKPLSPQAPNNLAGTAQLITENKGPAVPRVDPNIPNPSVRQATNFVNLNTNQIIELLTQQTEGSLQRTLTQQLHMLNTDNIRQQLVFELPIRHGNNVDVFDMRIHPDQGGSQQQEAEQARPWTIMMAFDLEGLGPVRAQISLVNDRISTHWWAEQQLTVELFQQHMATLQDRLSHVGLEVEKVQCQCGVPQLSTQQEQKTHYSDINLDEEV